MARSTKQAGGSLFREAEKLDRAAAMAGFEPAWAKPVPMPASDAPPSAASKAPSGGPSDQSAQSEHTQSRTRLFITLVRGTFGQGNHRNPRNVQVRVRLLASGSAGVTAVSRGTNGPSSIGDPTAAFGPSGHLQEHRLGMSVVTSQGNFSLASAAELLGNETYTADEYRSTVYYHCNSPLIGEQVCVTLDDTQLHLLEDAHLEFSFWHAFSAESRCQCFSFGMLRLTDSRGVVVQDGSHEVLCYEP